MLLGGSGVLTLLSGGPAAVLPRLAKAENTKSLAEVLRDDSASGLRLSFSLARGQRLDIEGGTATLLRCPEAVEAACTPVGTPLVLSGGERAQLVSRLRASELAGLQSTETPLPSDRTLTLALRARSLGSWRLPRSEFPVPPDGMALPDFLDELGRRIQQASEARKPVAVPQTLDELRALRLQVKLEPRRRPGGLLVIEGGKLRVQPQEGFVPRNPAPAPSLRGLSAAEEQQLLAALQQAGLDTLDGRVEKRAEPAIGDDDGRVFTLHLLPSEGSSGITGQPRGLQRYVADLRRSSAAPLVELVVSWLTTATVAAPSEKSGRRSPHPR